MLNSGTANQLPGPPHFVDLHVNPGESVSIQFLDGNETVLRGPTTIKMISQCTFPPMPMPVQVPPGHMIQQVVDENGTLKHIILSALNANSAFMSNQQQGPSQQQHQQPFCCCCNNTCAPPAQVNNATSATGTPLAAAAAAAAAVAANQIIQPQYNHSSMVFPSLSHSPANTYVRNRRSTRNYSSPNKRSSYNTNVNNNNNYYSSSPSLNKGTQARFVKTSSHSDNLKSSNNQTYNRYGNTMHGYDRSSFYMDQMSNDIYNNSNNKYPNKSYDYSYNSSNTSQISSLDQMNDNIKYYKDDHYSVDDDNYNKKSYSSLNSEAQNHCYMDGYTPEEDDILTNDVENMSQKSSLSESGDTNHEYLLSNENNFDMNYNVKQQSNYDSIKVSKTVNNESNIQIDNKSQKERNICDTEKLLTKKFDEISTNNNYKDQKSNQSTKPIIVLDDKINESDILLEPNSEAKIDETIVVEVKMDAKEEKCWSNNSDNKSSIANGHLDHLLDLPDSNSGSEQIETDKTESESDENERGDKNKVDQSISSPSRSPKPKIEVLTLTCTTVTSTSVRLKWTFNQPNEYPEQKRHYIVDLLLNHHSNEDTPNTRRMAHQGPNTCCRVGHLQPQHEYTFRVRTSTESAWLVSNILTVVTPESTPSFNRSGRRTNKLHNQGSQQQQLIYQQQQSLQQQTTEQEKKKQQASDLMNSGGVVSTDQGYALFLVFVFTIISLIVAVLINHLLGNHW